MKISLIGNCQVKGLTWYIQQLNLNFDVKYIWTDIGMASFALKNVFQGKPTPTIVSAENAHDRLLESDYIIYQPIRPSRIKEFNYEDIKKYGAKSKLISIGCFYCKRANREGNSEEYEKKTGLLGMKERARNLKLDIHVHKIIEKYGVDAVATNVNYHPRALYFLELVREICAKTGWSYYSQDQYDQYLEEGYPFQRKSIS